MSTPTTAVATLAPYHSHRYHAPPYTHHHQGHPMATTAGFRNASGTTILPPSVTGSTTTTTTTAAVSTSQSHRLPPFYQTMADNAGYQYTPEAVVPLHHRPPSTSRPHAHQYSQLDAVLEAAAPPSSSSSRFEDGYAAAPIGNTATTNMTTTSTAQAKAGVVPDDQPSRKRRRSREPDWGTFYRNGLPKEVIVIHDTPEPEANTGRKVVTSTTTTATTTTAADTHPRQATKKRRRDEAPGHHYHVQYAASTHTNASLQESTPGSSTISSDRTSALHTTAPTSLGSSSQYGEALAPLKRKRITRQQAANEAKRREADVLTGPFATYRPPPFPPKKAGEVHVRAIQDHPYNKGIKVDDEDGHYIVVPDADLTESYRIVRLLGQGTFGKVVQAHDRKQNKAVAIKIIRSVQKYRDASRIELRVLATIKANDEDDRNRCIHLRDCFDFRGHICIVMDLLGQSVFDFLKGNGFVPFPNSHIQSFARQLFSSVAFLHDLNLIHTDLKPENILLYDNAYQTFTYNRKIPSSSTTINRQATQRRVLLDTEIRLIDFGSATFQDEYHSSVVSTRHYRAPEIILGLGWSFPCDIWSIGCILVEFFTGDALFQTHDNLEHLAMMEAVVGSRIDTHLVQGVNKMTTRGGGNPASKYFKRLRLDYPTPETTRGSRRFVKAMKHLEDIIPSNNTFFRNFLDLLRRIFVYDPAHRITAKEALDHAWFKEMAQPDDGTEAAKIRLERKRMELEKRHAHYVG